MSDTRVYDNWARDKKIKKVEKSKRATDKYRRLIHNMSSGQSDDLEDVFDDYLDSEYVEHRTKTR